MHTPNYSFIAMLAALLLYMPSGGLAKDDEGLEVGKEMPFHVVDFLGGKKESGAGCPSVMISNSDGQGIIIWSRGLSEAAFKLAKALDAEVKDGDKLQRFLVVFDAEKEAISKKAEGLVHTVAGKARHSAKQEFDGREVPAKTNVLVFFLDKKTITAGWSFGEDGLSDEKVKEIAAAAKKLGVAAN